MDGLPGWARGSACLVFSLCACGPEPLAVDYGCGDLRKGDLVITEVHPNPDGTDGDGEYIEVFNPGAASIALQGLTLVAGRSDGQSPKAHRLLEGSIGPRSYFTFGNAAAGSRPDYLDYSYGNELGNLRNADGVVSVWCGDELIDGMTYARTEDGRALELDGGLAPDHETNDDPDVWCDTPEGAGSLGDGNFGTPGRRNTPCNAPATEGTCIEGGSMRLAVAPRPEDVRITEWMANPEGVDTGHEWVEVSFDGNADLNGFALGPSVEELRLAVEGEECFPVGAGARVVFGASPAAAPRVDAELGFSLGNTDARLIVAAIGGMVLDRVRYERTVEGVSWQIDEDGGRCLAELAPAYDEGNRGTPGDANAACPVELAPGQCLEAGQPRDIARPTVGDARIVEWMANPAVVENRAGEWIELSIDAALDLNGLTLTDLADNTTTIESEACLRVAAGTHVVLVRSLDESVNGGIHGATAELTLSLNNRDEAITLGIGDQVLDAVSYAKAEAGVATQIDDAGKTCLASTTYGDGDLGTPGQPNPSCN